MLGRGISRSLAAMAMMAGASLGGAPVALAESSNNGRTRNPFLEPGESRSERRVRGRFSRKADVTTVSGVSLKGVPRFTKPLQWLKSHADRDFYHEAYLAAGRGDGKRVQQMARTLYATIQKK